MTFKISYHKILNRTSVYQEKANNLTEKYFETGFEAIKRSICISFTFLVKKTYRNSFLIYTLVNFH